MVARAHDDDAADRFAATVRVDEAVRDRHRRAALAARALQDATVVSALLGAVDRTATMHLRGSTTAIAGMVVAVGSDVVEVTTATATWWCALGAVTAVETSGALVGDPADRAPTSMLELATDLVDRGEPVTALLADGAALHGEVTSVGESLVLSLHHPERSAVIAVDHLVAISRRS